MALSDVVRRWLEELGWEQKEVVRRSAGRLSQGGVSDMRRGRIPNPTFETVSAYADVFGVSLDVLRAAAAAPPEQIPSIVEALPPDLAGLPAWARDFHRWGAVLTPQQRQAILDLVRDLASAAEMPADTPAEPGIDDAAAERGTHS